MNHRSKAFPATLLVCAVLAPANGWAFERELQVGIDLFYAQQFIDDEDRPPGGGVGARARYGFNDALAIAVAAAWAGHSVLTDQETTVLRQIVTASAGIHYAIDVLRFVPYLSLLVGSSTTLQEDTSASSFLLDVGGGVDWMATPSFSVGVAATYQLTVGEEVVPARLCVAIRLSWHRRFGGDAAER